MKPKDFHKSKKTQKANPSIEQTTTTPEEFSFAITRVAVSQICKSVGFKGAQSSSLETLTLVTTKYLQELSHLAASYSHASHRTQSNIFDLINALHDLNLIQGFVGASKNGNTCLLSCSLLKEIECFVKHTEETPFAKPVPRAKNKTLSEGLLVCSTDNKEMMSSRGLSLHIPKWLPVFPDLNTYKDCRRSVYEKRRSLWETSELVEGGCGGEVKVREQSLGDDLAIERGKVRFKIGVKVGKKKNGFCGQENEENDRKSEFKRRRC